jgi:glycosyltransferase involved in cell wall biosynthesis
VNTSATVQLSVLVPTYNRPLRLRWLLNALEHQTLDRSRWEVVVSSPPGDEATAELLAAHPLAGAGVLRATTRRPGRLGPGANRNAAARLARGPILVFTDDDCRPPATWLESVRDAVRRHPGAIIQGPTLSDPEEMSMGASPFPRTQAFTRVPRPWAETCNIVYPRELFEQLGGFREDWETCEDTDLCIRGQAAGAPYVGETSMLTYHCIQEGTLRDRLREAWRWRHLPQLIKTHPQLREALPLWVFFRRSHAWLPLALAGLALERRNPLWALLMVPWAGQWEVKPGGPEERLSYLLGLPGCAAIDLAEMSTMIAGSIRYRSLML